MLNDPLLLSLQDTKFAIGFLKLKRNWKEKNVSITESLTKRRVIELKKSREMYDFRNVWSHDGEVLFSDVNDRNKVKVFYDWYLNLRRKRERKRLRLFCLLCYTFSEFWRFCTVLLLITKNIGNAPLTLKIISRWSFTLFEHENFIILLLQFFSIFYFFLVSNLIRQNVKYLALVSWKATGIGITVTPWV